MKKKIEGAGLVKPINSTTEASKKPVMAKKRAAATPVKDKRSGNGGAREGAGRKDDYTPDLIDKLRAFFNINDDAFTEVETEKGLTMLVKRPPTFQRFAAMVGINRVTLQSYSTAAHEDGSLKYPEYAKAYEIAKSIAEAIKIEGATMKLYDSKMVTFDLQVNHGWIPETVQHVHHTMDENKLEDAYQEANVKMLEREAQAKKDKELLIGQLDGDIEAD